MNTEKRQRQERIVESAYDIKEAHSDEVGGLPEATTKEYSRTIAQYLRDVKESKDNQLDNLIP